MPKVSVIIPLYNAQEYIEETLNSVLNQTFQDLEIIVVDDSSTDGSVPIVEMLQKQDKRIKLYKNVKNSGIAYTRNAAIKYSQGEYIALLDDDDLAPPYRLMEEVEFLDLHQDYMVVGGHCVKIDEEGKDLHKDWSMFLNYKFIKAYLLLANPVPNGAAMFRKQFIIDNGILYEDNMYGCEDYQFWVKCSVEGKIGTIDKVMLYWRNYATSETRKTVTQKIEKRKEAYASIQKMAFEKNGFQLSDSNYEILCKVFAEEGQLDSKEELYQIYEVMYDVVAQAKKMNMENADEISALCRKKFAEKLGKAFFLWE